MLRLLLLFSLSTMVACGPKTGAVSASSATAAAESADSIGRALDELLVKTTDVDRRTRLSTFRSLWDASVRWPEGARRDLQRSLELLIEVELRGLDEEMGPLSRVGDEESGPSAVDSAALLDMGTEEETLGDDPVERVVESPDIDAVDRLAEAKKALTASDYRKALGLLEEGHASGTLTEAEAKLWEEAVEGFVRMERERAGELFVSARAMNDGTEKNAKIQIVAEILEGLLRNYPGSRYESAIRSNLEIVRQEMGTP